MKQYFLLLCFLYCTLIAYAQVTPHLFFENSALPYSFSRSKVVYQGHSWVRNLQQRLPVRDTIFLTPGNALELSYHSDSSGTWHADIYAGETSGMRVQPSQQLYMHIHMPEDMPVELLPDLQLLQEDEHRSDTLALQHYLKKNPEGPWSRIEIPLEDIPGFQSDLAILGLRFLQGKPGDKDYTIYLDQVEILPSELPDSKLTGAAVLTSVKAYQQHALLQWKLPLTPSIRYIQIYRSSDNKDFVPIAIRRAPIMRYTDILPDTSRTYYYKIAWVDYDFQTSPFSTVQSARSRPMDTEELLDMVQKSHIRYYLYGREFYSGMQRLSPQGQGNLVSTKGTGMGLMAMLVGLRQQMINPSQLRARVNKICDFLLKAETFQGAFPAILDGKTGKGAVIGDKVLGGDLVSTAYLVQGLLITREYFRDQSAEDKQLRAKIDTLWRNVAWDAYKKEGKHYLYNTWNPDDGLDTAIPLSGVQSLPVYILAMSSPTHSISIEDYAEGMAKPLIFQENQLPLKDSIAFQQNQLQDSVLSEQEETDAGTWMLKPYVKPEVYAGIPLVLNKAVLSLRDILMAFSGVDPRDKQDAFVDYYQEVSNLIRIRKRLNEEGSSQAYVLSGGLGGGLDNQLDFNTDVASYAFTPEIALEYLEHYYRGIPQLSWSGYGLRSRLDLNTNRYIYGEDVTYRALVPVMIENARTGMIWDLFNKIPEIQIVMRSIYLRNQS